MGYKKICDECGFTEPQLKNLIAGHIIEEAAKTCRAMGFFKKLNESRKGKRLNESSEFDVAKIDPMILEMGYVDYRYCDLYRDDTGLRKIGEHDDYGNGVDGTINRLLSEFPLCEEMILTKPGENGTELRIVIADIGDNVELLKKRMEKEGYFFTNYINNIESAKGTYTIMRFEPYPKGEGMIPSTWDYLYHVTPFRNFESILKNGLLPKNQNRKYSYPKRIYLRTTSDNLSGIANSLRQETNEKDIPYAALEISTDKLDPSMRFYYDPSADKAVYTVQPIPPTAIKLLKIV